MQFYCLVPTEEMALRNEEKDWVTEAIRAAIREHLNPHGWRKLQESLPLAGVLAVFVALLMLAGAGWKYAFSRVETEVQFQTHTTDTLNRTTERLIRIEGALSVLQAQIAATKYSALPAKELKDHRDELKSIQDSLAKTRSDAPNFWPTSFQIITLLSKTNFGIEPSGKPGMTFSNVSGISPRTINIPRGTEVLLENLIQNSVFQDMIVHFDPSVRLQNVTFINCILIFPMEQNPPKPLQEIGNALLASDVSKVTITAS